MPYCDMKRFWILIFGTCVLQAATAQSAYQSNTKQTTASPDNKVNFRLFQTNNRWTFLKLDTRNGEIMQVQYDMGDNAVSFESETFGLWGRRKAWSLFLVSNREHF